MNIDKETTILRNLTISAFKEREKAIVYIDLMRSNLKEEPESEEERFVLTYLDFLMGLAKAGDQEDFLREADSELVKFMRGLLVNKISNEVEKKFKSLTEAAFKYGEFGEELIKKTLEMLLAEGERPEEGGETLHIRYLRFLLKLSRSKDKKTLLAETDKELTDFMNRLLAAL